MKELNFIPSSPTVIYRGKKSIISMIKNPMFHKIKNHIKFYCHFIRDHVISVTIEMKLCPTKYQVADGLMKALNDASFTKFQGDLGVNSFESKGSVEG